MNKTLSSYLNRYFANYSVAKVSNGMSPAEVFQLSKGTEVLYLKTIAKVFSDTTYSLTRESKMMSWLNGKLPVPFLIDFYEDQISQTMVFTKAEGMLCSDHYLKNKDPFFIIDRYCGLLEDLKNIDIADCPFSCDIDFRLKELKFLMDSSLADISLENWDSTTQFSQPAELYQFLEENKISETFVFSHGDLSDMNIFISSQSVTGLIDLGRSGKADYWHDVAFVIRSIREDYGEKYLDYFFEKSGTAPDWTKIKYHLLLDEMF
jgi:aminoglycoside 3'-phosphotransferase-3